MLRASTPKHASVRRTDDVPHVFFAPTQVERVARENNARIEYVPILLGALFKAIGTPNVPMLAVSPAKREYMSKDLQDWCAWHGVEFNFPSVFPIRTVLPLRVAIQVRAVPVQLLLYLPGCVSPFLTSGAADALLACVIRATRRSRKSRHCCTVLRGGRT